ncbi:MAG: 30S ribosomal protein S6 [Firmicutes bacterium]|nr:30S ribosomal protein S6 [Bacillota bacterium]
MAQYELMYILKPDLGDEAQQAAIDRVHQILETSGGTIDKTDKWGRRKLAYEIAKYGEGFYVVVNFHGAGTIANEVSRLLRINEDILRSMVIRVDE